MDDRVPDYRRVVVLQDPSAERRHGQQPAMASARLPWPRQERRSAPDDRHRAPPQIRCSEWVLLGGPGEFGRSDGEVAWAGSVGGEHRVWKGGDQGARPGPAAGGSVPEQHLIAGWKPAVQSGQIAALPAHEVGRATGRQPAACTRTGRYGEPGTTFLCRDLCPRRLAGRVDMPSELGLCLTTCRLDEHVAKVRVAGSNPVVRSTETPGPARGFSLSTSDFAPPAANHPCPSVVRPGSPRPRR
jgi:hypothetical protein